MSSASPQYWAWQLGWYRALALKAAGCGLGQQRFICWFNKPFSLYCRVLQLLNNELFPAEAADCHCSSKMSHSSYYYCTAAKAA